MLRPPRSSARLFALALLALAPGLGAAPGDARAQQEAPRAQVRLERGPYYVGDPIEVHVQATGLDRSPEPRCVAEAPAGATLTLGAVVPTISSAVQIVGGRVERMESVTFVCQYVLVAQEPGSVRLAPFVVEQAGRRITTASQVVDVQPIPLDPRVRLRVVVPDGPVYIGQQIPVRIEWWLDSSLQESIRRYSIRSALFEAPDTFRFVDDTIARRGETSLELATAEGDIAIRAEVETRPESGRQYLVVSGERRMVPLRAGRFELPPATLNVDEVTGWQRDLFGSRRPTDTRRLFARDEPIELVVEPAPERGRPPSFGGAVGSGFSIDARADRSVVQRGDPITLTLTIRGDGQLDTVGLPPLDGPGGLDPTQFRVLDEAASGEIVDGAKRFEVPVRVVDESVREIPPIEYAWFDPDLGEYQTARSRPIALSVRPAEVVSADDVVAARPPEEAAAETGDATAGSADGAALEAGQLGADLAIERDVARLAARPPAWRPVRLALYGSGLAGVLGAALWRRRRDATPRTSRLRALCVRERARLVGAKSGPAREAVTDASAAMRRLRAADPGLAGPEVDALLRSCEDILYAPGPVDDEAARACVTRAIACIDAAEESLR
jgi:hypothetical protein